MLTALEGSATRQHTNDLRKSEISNLRCITRQKNIIWLEITVKHLGIDGSDSLD
jgi:hypothetical protein